MKPCITKREAQHISEALAERWEEHLRPGERFVVSGQADAEEVHLVVRFESDDQSVFYPMEARLDRGRYPENDVAECAWLLLDALDAYIGQFLEAERLDRLPLDWTDTTFQDAVIQVKGELRNMKAERAAQAWLERFEGGGGLDD
jgi:hypothetical protein